MAFLQSNRLKYIWQSPKETETIAITDENPVFTDVFEKIPKTIPYAAQSFEIKCLCSNQGRNGNEFGDHKGLPACRISC
ncbi:MAG: hypothetical protein IPI65_08330 [Bacteroidetes bacterium]|nr:hypothetical protein [Bacteroidota bacterium]